MRGRGSHRKIKILYFSSFGDSRGGGQESLFQLLTHLDRNTYEPYVALPREGDLVGKFHRHGVEVIVVDLPRILDLNLFGVLKALTTLLKIIRTRGIDIVHTDGPRNTFYGGIAARLFGIPLIWHIRISEKDRYDCLLYHLSTQLILVANNLRERFEWVKSNRKFVTIYNAVDSLVFRGTGSGRVKSGAEGKKIIIACIARIEPMKGQKYLIEACGNLPNTFDNFCLLFIGDVADHAYYEECFNSTSLFGIRDHIHFTGYRSNIEDILKTIDIFVLPSLSEAFPRSVIEAMAAGKPVIVTDVGGCAEAVEDGISGFIVPPANSKVLSDVICRLGSDSTLRVRVGDAARKRAEAMFDIKRNVELTERLYRKVIA